MPAPRALTFRRHADKSDGDRVKRFDPESGEAYLADPATWSREDPETWVACPWPFAGIEIVDDDGGSLEGKYLAAAIIPTTTIERGLAEGWVSLEGSQMVHRPGGPEAAPWRVTHSFRHAEAIVFHTTEGDVRYVVTQQPDKWPESKNELDEGFGGDVRWFYLGRLA